MTWTEAMRRSRYWIAVLRSYGIPCASTAIFIEPIPEEMA